MKQTFLLVLVLSACIVQGQTNRAKPASANADSNSKKANYTIKIIPVADGKFGYDIYANNKLFIHQPIIPGIPGNSGFATSADAQKVADAAVNKMQAGAAMPSIAVAELKRLHITMPTNKQP